MSSEAVNKTERDRHREREKIQAQQAHLIAHLSPFHKVKIISLFF